MNYFMIVEVVERFEYLGKIVDHNSLLLLHEFDILVDVFHKVEEIVVGT